MPVIDGEDSDKMKDRLLIIGASGHGRVVADVARHVGRWETIAYLDDDVTKCNQSLVIVGRVSDSSNFISDSDFLVAIGDNAVREKIQKQLLAKGASMATLIHPYAIIGSDVSIGAGTVVMMGTVVNSGTNIGDGCIINTSSSIDHDNTIGDYVHISPGVRTAGNVSVGRGTWVGIGSVISNNVSITTDCVLGAGSVVVKDIQLRGTYVGVPVRRI